MGNKFGPTGKHPFGRINKTDDGELQMGVTHDHEHGTVILNFGVPVAWIGIYPDQAKQMAEAMIKHADAILRTAS